MARGAAAEALVVSQTIKGMINITLPVTAAVIATGLLAASQAERPPVSADTYFPSGAVWQTVAPGSVGWSTAALDRAVEFAGNNRSTGLLILDHGRIVVERYWDIENPLLQEGIEYRAFRVGTSMQGEPIEDVASIQKSVVSLLLGIAVSRGYVGLDTTVSAVLGEGWSRATPAQERGIQIRHLLSMTSGLTEQLTVESEPGQQWHYNTLAYSYLLRVLARASGLTADELTERWLTSRIGAADTRWVPRRSGGPNTVGLATTVRDLGRVGILVTSNGIWAGDSIVSSSWVRALAGPSQVLNPAYGRLWWVNNGDSWEDWDHQGMKPGPFIPSAPAELIAARGVGDRRLYVIPSRQVVVARIGATARFSGDAPDLQFFDREFWLRLMQALPAG